MKSFVAADNWQKLYVNGKLLKDVDVSLEGNEKGINIDAKMNGIHKKKYIKSSLSQMKQILGTPSSSENLENRLSKLLSNKLKKYRKLTTKKSKKNKIFKKSKTRKLKRTK